MNSGTDTKMPLPCPVPLLSRARSPRGPHRTLRFHHCPCPTPDIPMGPMKGPGEAPPRSPSSKCCSGPASVPKVEVLPASVLARRDSTLLPGSPFCSQARGWRRKVPLRAPRPGAPSLSFLESFLTHPHPATCRSEPQCSRRLELRAVCLPLTLSLSERGSSAGNAEEGRRALDGECRVHGGRLCGHL